MQNPILSDFAVDASKFSSVEDDILNVIKTNNNTSILLGQGFPNFLFIGTFGQFMDSLVYPENYITSSITIFSSCKRKTGSLKINASAEVLFSTFFFLLFQSVQPKSWP